MPSTASRLQPVASIVVALALFAALAPEGGTRATQAPRPAAAAPEEDATAFLDRIPAVWERRDLAAWIALWDISGPEQRTLEEEVARAAFASDETELTYLRRPSLRGDATSLSADVQVFVVEEPRARVAYWRLTARKRDGRWAIVGREDTGAVDGLVHLSLAQRAWRARGVSLRLEDFELRLEDGTLFTTPEALGPTALVFVGRGRVRIAPRPPAEREQLRQFGGLPEIDREVSWAFVRIHPADLSRVLPIGALEPDPAPDQRRTAAERVWREHAERSFIMDAPLPRSPWWLLPNLGDAVVDFPYGRRRGLTFAISGGEPEDINLFDRDRRLQICSYPSGGRPPRYSEDDHRAVDVLSHDLTVRFEPERFELRSVHTMRLRLLAPTSTLRLRLHDDFRVGSVTTDDGGNLLFFRVRGQNSLVVSLGPNATRVEPFSLTVRYSGRHDPAPIDEELVQATTPSTLHLADVGFVDRPPLVYSNRTAWYAHPGNEDFAPARLAFDTPEGWLAVTGGELVSVRREAGRTRAEYRLDRPGKFITAVVGRFEDVGLRQEGEQAVRGFGTPRARNGALRQMQTAEEMLTFYAQRFGPCPYPTLNLALAEAGTPGGHSPPGLILLQQRPLSLLGHSLPDDPANFGDLSGFFLAHELAHQWWGQGVAPANYHERWISEAWAQYAAALWVRQTLGEEAFRRMMDRMARWAQRHDAGGPIHLGQRLGHLKGDPRIFRAVVYDKGAWVLHMLRGLVGDEAFFGGARAFLEGHRYAKAGTEDLRAALEKASGRELTAYFERWIYATGLPTLVWSSHTEKTAGGSRTTVEVRPQALPGPVPMEIAVCTSKGRETRRVTLDPAGGSWTIDTPQDERDTQLNEDRGLLARLERVRQLPGLPLQR
jgi:hypothetical protein